VSTDINDLDTAPVMARISCPCGFEVVGADEENNQYVFADHECTLNPPEPQHWYDAVFSFYGVVMACALAWLIATIVTNR
jgi:phage terminase large subunit-like protein